MGHQTQGEELQCPVDPVRGSRVELATLEKEHRQRATHQEQSNRRWHRERQHQPQRPGGCAAQPIPVAGVGPFHQRWEDSQPHRRANDRLRELHQPPAILVGGDRPHRQPRTQEGGENEVKVGGSQS